VIVDFDTSTTPLPPQKERSYETIKASLDNFTFRLVEAMKPELKAKVPVEEAKDEPKTPKTLIVRGRVEKVQPGSQAARYIIGFGAGATQVKISGEIVDAQSGKVLARFTQERRSAGTFKPLSGQDSAVIRDAIHAAGKDVAHILDAF